MPIFVCRVINRKGQEEIIEHSFPDEATARHSLLTGLLDIDSGLTLKFREVVSIDQVDDDYFDKKLANGATDRDPWQDIANGEDKVILTTSFAVAGRDIMRDLSVVTARQVQGINILSDAVIDLSNVFGGTSSTFESYMEDAERTVLWRLRAEADRLGADAVVCVKVMHNHLPPRMLMTFAIGTAVRLQPIEGAGAHKPPVST